MFNKILSLFDKVPDDSLTERIFKQDISSKYVMYYSISFIVLISSIVVEFLIISYKSNPQPAQVFSVMRDKNGLHPETTKIIPVTLPVAHQSFQNISNWLTDAVVELYSFDFLDYDKKVNEAQLYFTSNGYSKYLEALNNSGVKSSVIDKKVIVSTVPLGNPILVNSGNIDGVDYWRFKVPVLINYTGGDKPISTKSLFDVNIQQVPAYISHKGIAITNFSIENL